MGKVPYIYTDSEETEDTSGSTESAKKKKRFSILKYSNGKVKKKKCKLHSKSEPDEPIWRRSRSKVQYRLPGILKNSSERERQESSEDEEEPEYSKVYYSQDRCLVGQVPRPVGAKPGRGGGVAIIVKKNISNMQPQQSTSSTKRRRRRLLARKRSY